MGTRATVTVYNESDQPICSIYIMFDGYLNGVGKQLQEFLKTHRYVNGIPLDATNVYNGMEDLAAQLVWHLKEGKPGNVYLVPLEGEHDFTDYEYEIRFVDGDACLRELTQKVVLYPEVKIE